MPFDVQGALKEGYSEAEIADFLGRQQGFDSGAARREGYSDREILQHLMGVPKAQPALPQPAPTAGTASDTGAPPPAPAPNAGSSQWSPDDSEAAREAAALRVARGVQPPGGRTEGATTRSIEGVLPAAHQALLQAGETAKTAVQTGDLPPKQAIETAMMATPVGAAYRTGRGIAFAALPPELQAARQVGVTVPSVATAGPTKQAFGRAISIAPGAGGPLKSAADRATEELLAAGGAAAARPTGEVVAQDVAGGHIRAGLERILTETAKEPTSLREVAQQGVAKNLYKDLGYLLKKSDEDIMGEVIRMAGSKSGADVKNLVQLRKVVDPSKQPEMQSAIIDRLGKGPTGDFDPKAWIRNYGTLSERAKDFMFGDAKTGLRYHLDSLETTARMAPKWQQFARERATLGTKVGVAALSIGALVTQPLAVISAVVPMRVIASAMARPATAAPLAQWSKAYGEFVRTSGAPQSIAGLSIATRNLNNTLGTDVSMDDILKASSAGEE